MNTTLAEQWDAEVALATEEPDTNRTHAFFCAQRSRLREGILSDSEIARLDEASPGWRNEMGPVGTIFPETRKRQFDEWCARVDEVVAFFISNNKYPRKLVTTGEDGAAAWHEERLGTFLHRMRSLGRAQTLHPDRRAYLDEHLPGWLPARPSARDSFTLHARTYADAAAAGERPAQGDREWLLSLRIRAAVRGIPGWQADVLHELIPAWRTEGVDDWFGTALALRRQTRDGEKLTATVSRFLSSEQAKFCTGSLHSDRLAALDICVPGWEETADGFGDWFWAEAQFARDWMDAREDDGYGMIHDAMSWSPRARFFFTRLARQHKAGRLSDEALQRLRAIFDTMDGYLGIGAYRR